MNQTTDQISVISNDGWDAIESFLKNHQINSILLVTGGSSYTTSGAEQKLAPILQSKRTRRISDFEVNPKAGDIQRILDSLSTDQPYDAILTVGGGSAMDVGKLIKAYSNNSKNVAQCIVDQEPVQPADIPLIAVPTTAGSGSEATHFAVVYHNQEKFSIDHEQLRPDLAVVVPSLLTSLPPGIAAASGMDALCQGIESYWSIHSTEQSQAIAKEAINLAWNSLTDAVLHKSPEALETISQASHLAGQAINLTKTTAPHAVSYALTTFYQVPHGHAVGLLVPYILTYNAQVSNDDCLDPRGPVWVSNTLQEIAQLLGCNSTDEAKTALLKLMQSIGLTTRIHHLGVQTAEDIHVIVKNGFNPERVNNNPRKLTKAKLHDILTEMIST